MNIGIIDAGHVGSILAELWNQKGHKVLLNLNNPQKNGSSLKNSGSSYKEGSMEQAAQFSDVILLSVPFSQIAYIARKVLHLLNGKTLIDSTTTSNQINKEIFQHNFTSGVTIQKLFPESKVVRAFCSICFIDMKIMAHRSPQLISVPFCSDDNNAKDIITGLISDAGFDPYYLGPLNKSQPIDQGGKIFAKALTKLQIQDLLDYAQTQI